MNSHMNSCAQMSSSSTPARSSAIFAAAFFASEPKRPMRTASSIVTLCLEYCSLCSHRSANLLPRPFGVETILSFFSPVRVFVMDG